MVLRIRWSKTLQLREREEVVTLARRRGSPLDPVLLLRAVLARVPAAGDAHAFSLPAGPGGALIPLSFAAFSGTIARIAHALGAAPRVYATHSPAWHKHGEHICHAQLRHYVPRRMRRGGATFAFAAGARGELIKLHGAWRSEAYQRYLAPPLAARLEVGHLIHDAVLGVGLPAARPAVASGAPIGSLRSGPLARPSAS